MDNPTQNNFKKMQKNSTVYCFIPGCRSNTQRFPRKLFVNVPTDPNIREQWMIAAKRTFYSSKTVFRCCEDHFDLKNDVKNWMKFRFVRGPLYLKEGVIPRFFNFNKKPEPKEPVDSRKNMYHDHNYARIHIEGAFGNTEPSSSDSRLNKEVQVERNNEKIQENLPSEVKIEPCDFYKDFDTYVKEVIQKDGNQYENVVENNTRDLYRDHVIKEEMVIGPVVIKEEEDYEPVCRCKSNKINTTDYTKMEDWIDFQEENEPYEFNNDTNTNIIEETEN